MTLRAINKKTYQKIYGRWDAEGLEFIYNRGSIAWDIFAQEWEIMDAKVERFYENRYKKITNHLFFCDVQMRDTMEKITVPLIRERETKKHIYFKPLIGKLPFSKCSKSGKVPNLDIVVYELPEDKNITAMIQQFTDMIKCENCLGVKQKCNYCFDKYKN